MKNSREKGSEYLKKLKFRRQFLVGPNKYVPNIFWNNQKLSHGFILSIHQDLTYLSKEKDGHRITLIGVAVDCENPYKTDAEITTSLLKSFDDINSVIRASKPLAGRWVLICQDAENTFIFTDPCGLRQVYYHSNRKNSWCASQPTLINQVKDLAITSEKSILNLKNSAWFKKKESAWVGDKTIYENCFHLMPNHYLNLDDGTQVRFFPKEPIPAIENENKLIVKVAMYLKNIILGLDYKFPIKICLTAGFDSRLLLAASVDISDRVLYSTDKLGVLNKYYDDIYIPKELGQKFNLNHEIIDSTKNPPSWFSQILTQNVSLARTSPFLRKTKAIYSKLANNDTEYILINGNVAEMVRINEPIVNYESSYDAEASPTNLEPLLNFYGYKNIYVNQEIVRWIETLDISAISEVTVFDMFHWENRMGNWGALFPAELDIAAESISPLNCRLLLETCFKVPRTQRMAPEFIFFKGVIKQLWPEVLSEPVNPGPRGWGLLKKNLKKKIPISTVKFIQKITG